MTPTPQSCSRNEHSIDGNTLINNITVSPSQHVEECHAAMVVRCLAWNHACYICDPCPPCKPLPISWPLFLHELRQHHDIVLLTMHDHWQWVQPERQASPWYAREIFEQGPWIPEVDCMGGEQCRWFSRLVGVPHSVHDSPSSLPSATVSYLAPQSSPVVHHNTKDNDSTMMIDHRVAVAPVWDSGDVFTNGYLQSSMILYAPYRGIIPRRTSPSCNSMSPWMRNLWHSSLWQRNMSEMVLGSLQHVTVAHHKHDTSLHKESPPLLSIHAHKCYQHNRSLQYGFHENLQINKPRVIVSLTSLPCRLPLLCNTLKRIIALDRGPFEHWEWDFVLQLPRICKRENKSYNVTQLREQFPMVRIHELDEDMGPGTKLLGVLMELDADRTEKEEKKAQQQPYDDDDTPNDGTQPSRTVQLLKKQQSWREHTWIITLDDDIIYPDHLFTHLLTYGVQYGRCALGYRAWRAQRLIQHDQYDLDYEHYCPYGSIRNTDVIEGYAGALYRADMFEHDWRTWWYQFPNDMRKVDDVWISGYLAIKRIPRKVIRYLPENIYYENGSIVSAKSNSNSVPMTTTGMLRLLWASASEHPQWLPLHFESDFKPCNKRAAQWFQQHDPHLWLPLE